MQRADVVTSVEAFTRAAAAETADPRGAAGLLPDARADVGQRRRRAPARSRHPRRAARDPRRRPARRHQQPGRLDRAGRADADLGSTCAELDGQRRCVSSDELRSAMSEADLAELGVPAWAREDVAKAEPRRRLEGLLVPGVYDVRAGRAGAGRAARAARDVGDPAGERRARQRGARDRLRALQGAHRLVAGREGGHHRRTCPRSRGCSTTGSAPGSGCSSTPRSTTRWTCRRCARTPTTGPSRGRTTATRSPGCRRPRSRRPGKDAIEAALAPDEGPWQYFVRCQPDGSSCFAETLDEHNRNVAEAVEQRGVLSRGMRPGPDS